MKDFNKYYDFIADEEIKLSVKKIADKAGLVSKTSITAMTDFENMVVIDYSIPIINNLGVKYKLFPNYDHSERKSLIIYPDFIEDCQIDENQYICGLRVYNKSKFRDLDHNNYLGSIMSLGIDRSKIGDIYVHQDFADIVCEKDIGQSIMYSLDKVGHNKVEAELIEVADIKYKEPEHEIISVGVASMRLDNVVKALINKARDTSADLIKTGDVKVNFVVEDKVSRILKEGDMISIRRFGRFYINQEAGNTKSGRIRLEIKHYTSKKK